MKKTYLLFLLLLTSFCFSQSYTVLNATAGEFMAFRPIYEDTDLFGYVELRKMNIDENNNNTIKYIVLDKNFNTVCSGNLTEKTSNSKRLKKLVDIQYAEGFIYFEFYEYSQAFGQDAFPYFKTYQIVDLKKNSIVNKGIYNPDVKDIDKQYDKIDTKGYFCYSLDKSGFLIQRTDYKAKIANEHNSFYAVNFKNEKIWEYKSTRELKKYDTHFTVVNYNEKYIVLKGFYKKGNKVENVHFLVLDSKTGKEIFYKEVSKEYTQTTDYTYLIEDKIYTGGRYFEKNKEGLYVSDKSFGIYQYVYDLKTSETVREKYVNYESFTDLDVNKYGKIHGEGHLTFQKCNLNPDGTFFILAEAYWEKQNYRAYTQLYTFKMDKDFNPVKTVKYEVKRTRGYKYDFAQRLANNSGRAYFFFDKNDDKDLELNILNYYFKSQKQVIQKMPITNDDSVINVFPAKSGYVGIAEYFKKPEKTGKFMEVRLEKLNYERE